MKLFFFHIRKVVQYRNVHQEAWMWKSSGGWETLLGLLTGVSEQTLHGLVFFIQLVPKKRHSFQTLFPLALEKWLNLCKHRIILKQPKSKAISRLKLHKLLEPPSSRLSKLAAAECGYGRQEHLAPPLQLVLSSTWELKVSSFYRYQVRLPRKWCCLSI